MIDASDLADVSRRGRRASVPRLPRRLCVLLDLLPSADAVADVGAGHGALAAHLARRGVAHVVATEARRGPLAELQRNLATWGVAVETRLGEGLSPLRPGEVEGVVAAGMGARTLLGICAQAGGYGLRWLALQCVQDPELVDPWLAHRGWQVLARCGVVERHHLYPTWVVEVGR